MDCVPWKEEIRITVRNKRMRVITTHAAITRGAVAVVPEIEIIVIILRGTMVEDTTRIEVVGANLVDKVAVAAVANEDVEAEQEDRIELTTIIIARCAEDTNGANVFLIRMGMIIGQGPAMIGTRIPRVEEMARGAEKLTIRTMEGTAVEEMALTTVITMKMNVPLPAGIVVKKGVTIKTMNIISPRSVRPNGIDN
jgi:hypothetical protein